MAVASASGTGPEVSRADSWEGKIDRKQEEQGQTGTIKGDRKQHHSLATSQPLVVQVACSRTWSPLSHLAQDFGEVEEGDSTRVGGTVGSVSAWKMLIDSVAWRS